MCTANGFPFHLDGETNSDYPPFMCFRILLKFTGCVLLCSAALGADQGKTAATTSSRAKSDRVNAVQNDPAKMVTRDFRLPANYFAAQEKANRWESPAQAAEARKDFREYLITRGVMFADGAKATLNDKATRVTIRNTAAQLDLIDVILNPNQQ